MYSRDIHSRDGGIKVRELLGSCLISLLLNDATKRPIYLISPWLSDFKLLNNTFQQFKDLFRYQIDFAENEHIYFSEILMELSNRLTIRIITWPNEKSIKFVNIFEKRAKIEVRVEENEKDHQKGLLSDLFYFEGSMNYTYSGVYIKGEKITCNADYYPEGNRKINEAYLEFDHIWDNLE